MKISATIITLNEEKDLPRCLKSLSAWVDEIILVDSGSTDKTLDIAKKYDAKIFKHEFKNYASQKNSAFKKARGDWIFSIDADEEVTKELEEEIKEVVKDDKFDGYSMPRKNIIFGKFIKYSRWQPELDRHVWLVRKGKGKWEGDVHEELECTGPVGKLKNAKIHYQYENVSEFMDMINRYSDIDSKERHKSGVKFKPIMLFMDPIYNFSVRYFYRLGFLDGVHGFVLSSLMAFYHFVLWVKIWELEEK